MNLIVSEELHSGPAKAPGTNHSALSFSNKITVEAVVDMELTAPEALQSIVSQWRIRADFHGFDAFDAEEIATSAGSGFFGAVFDGRHVYFCPMQYGRQDYHGKVLRFDTHADFKQNSSYEIYDASNTGGLDTRGYYGGAFDGRYVYFVPRKTEKQRHSRVLRFDSRGDFHSPANWDAYDAGLTNCRQGAAFDGRYLYFAPGYEDENPVDEKIPSNKVLRLDTRGDFHEASSWKVHDASGLSAKPYGCYDGAVFDGRHVYFVPLMHQTVLRYDTAGAFEDPHSWKIFDASTLNIGMNVGALFDGGAIYFIPYGHGNAVRLECRKEFSSPESWSQIDLADCFPEKHMGFDGGFYDGRYIYFVPFVAQGGEGPVFHTNFLRHECAKPFRDRASWSLTDIAKTNGLITCGYNAGVFDGRFFYCAPWRDGTKRGRKEIGVHATVLRYDTTGDQAVFSLRAADFGHNGGLCAAVPGPTFLVNTDKGVIGVSAHRTLNPGRHHIVGVYDGTSIRLYIDGELAAKRSASGNIANAAIPVTRGCLEDGSAPFFGRIEYASVSNEAKDERHVRERARQTACGGAGTLSHATNQ